MNMINHLPLKLKEFLIDKEIEENTIGYSAAQVYQVKDLKSDKGWFLKILKKESTYYHLSYEKEVLCWLKGKVKVPELEFYLSNMDAEYLVMSSINGMMLSSPEAFEVEPRRTIKRFGENLKELHDIDINNCPFTQCLETKLAIATENVSNRRVDREDFLPEFKKYSPEEMLNCLKDNQPEQQQVFTHGDYTLPNLILDEEKIGFIDLGLSGISDPYLDLAVAVKSIRMNVNLYQMNHILDELMKIFYVSYGLTKVDEKKIAYYLMLDDLF